MTDRRTDRYAESQFTLWLEFMASGGKEICLLTGEPGNGVYQTAEYWRKDARERGRRVTYHVWLDGKRHEVFPSAVRAYRYFEAERRW